jgi:hypothetical protein
MASAIVGADEAYWRLVAVLLLLSSFKEVSAI